VVATEWLRAIPDFELEPGCTPGFTFTQGGAIMPRSLPLRWGKGLRTGCGLARSSKALLRDQIPLTLVADPGFEPG
jgi:hypothetical protein